MSQRRTSTPRLRQLRWVFPMLLAAACSGGDPPNTDGDPQDIGADTLDAAAFDTSTDTRADVQDDPVDDVDDADDTDVTLAQPGELCADDLDCETELCIDIELGGESGVCGTYCTEDADCPRDFDCILIGGTGADARNVCLPVDLCIDSDGDGHGVGPGCMGPDCDDSEPGAFFGASEICDSIDNDCDAQIDEDPVGANEDCDTGFEGVCAQGRTTCELGEMQCVGRVGPTTEICDTFDNDCDGATDEGEDGGVLTRPCYDGDTDLIATSICEWGAQTCTDGGYSACIGQRLPSAEFCDALDNDCDGVVDEEIEDRSFYPDADGDGYGEAGADAVIDCAPPVGFIDNDDDCDDTANAVHPGVAEVTGDEIDQDCDGGEFCFEDADDDGYRRSSAILVSTDADCSDPGEAIADDPAGDCDDSTATIFPNASETCDGADNDCDDRVDEGVGCYPNGDACLDDVDCRSNQCVAGICTDCRELGLCPDRVAKHGWRRSTHRRRLHP